MAEPSEKKGNAHENPIAAKTDKSPQSRQSSGKQDTNNYPPMDSLLIESIGDFYFL